jgi:hypothetical protein
MMQARKLIVVLDLDSIFTSPELESFRDGFAGFAEIVLIRCILDTRWDKNVALGLQAMMIMYDIIYLQVEAQVY